MTEMPRAHTTEIDLECFSISKPLTRCDVVAPKKAVASDGLTLTAARAISALAVTVATFTTASAEPSIRINGFEHAAGYRSTIAAAPADILRVSTNAELPGPMVVVRADTLYNAAVDPHCLRVTPSSDVLAVCATQTSGVIEANQITRSADGGLELTHGPTPQIAALTAPHPADPKPLPAH